MIANSNKVPLYGIKGAVLYSANAPDCSIKGIDSFNISGHRHYVNDRFCYETIYGRTANMINFNYFTPKNLTESICFFFILQRPILVIRCYLNFSQFKLSSFFLLHYSTKWPLFGIKGAVFYSANAALLQKITFHNISSGLALFTTVNHFFLK